MGCFGAQGVRSSEGQTAPVTLVIMNCAIEFMSDVPDEVRDAVLPVLRRYLPFVPPTCRKLWVAFHDAASPDGGAIASTNGATEYGFMKLWIKPNWLKSSAYEREVGIAHELAHAIMWPVQVFTEQLLDSFVDEDAPLYRFTSLRMDECHETVIQNFAEAMYAMVNR